MRWLAGVLMWLPLAASAVETVRLDNGIVVLEVTPQLGGRGLGFSLQGRSNLLKVGEALTAQPNPEVSATAGDIGYLGHDVWLGPQSQWWTRQHVNPVRRDAKANWPPDPYLAFANTRTVERTSKRLVLEGVPSPVSGVQLRKTFALSPDRSDTAVLHVQARNIRDTPVAWDLWFNTRVSPTTRVYVPVASKQDVRVESSAGATIGELLPRIQDGLFSFERRPLPDGMSGRRGKVFLQPSEGWMAGFAGDQLFIIRFPHRARSLIHPEQGQVELYLDETLDASKGLLEMEVHAPYRTLQPEETMEAEESWTVLAYGGADTYEAQVAFLCGEAAKRLEMPELCRADKHAQ
ncbi:DUF4380 domain-containing protein [Pseudoxanthomonas sp. UTMC 1351]|uniref:DUF4380 domain-containing protein n=1 Tax=Pseudoxanthomonas sp. UTMC 1351 TaxID=2695853 RepID=UPI0034CF4B66